MTQKPRPAVKKPPPHTDEAGSNDRRESAADRRRPPEPFEECGPSGGYGGAGTDEAEDED
jgi:hypothetical protein